MGIRIGRWSFMDLEEAFFYGSAAVFESVDALASYCGLTTSEAESLFRRYGNSVAAAPARTIGDTSGRNRPASFLKDIYVPIPSVPQSAKPTPEPEPDPWFEVTMFTDDGEPIPGVKLEISDDWGFSKNGETDADGKLHIDTQLETHHNIKLVDAPIKLPALSKEPVLTKGFTFDRNQSDPFTLSSNKPHTLIVARPRATVVSLDGWWEGQSVMIFQNVRKVEEDTFVTVRGVLRTALTSNRGGEVHVIGHTDTEGRADDNEALALERARSVHFFLAGKRQEWADHAFSNADVATLQAALSWAAKATEIQCDPGPVDGDWGPATALGLSGLREHAGISQQQPLGAEDWAAIYDLFDEDLSKFMMLSRESLNQLRSTLTIKEPAAKGERFPVDAPDLNEHESPANRRVDVVLCAKGALPEPESDELYDETFLLEHLPVSFEVTVRIRIVNTGLTFMGFGILTARIGRLGPRFLVADPTGLVEVTVLGDDFIQVEGGTNAFGHGYTMAINFPELIAAELAAGDLV
jgi:hypothetical protein